MEGKILDTLKNNSEHKRQIETQAHLHIQKLEAQVLIAKQRQPHRAK